MSGETNGTSTKSLNLFDYTEEQLLQEEVLTHYQILGVEHHVSLDGVKKAYRKASLKYHPDKTGRGDDDYVFLAVKRAYDVLSDHTKRSAYDSTTVPFDESIPPPRSQLIQDPEILYKDEDFYGLFGPVFERNLRFDANLRPDAPGVVKKKKQQSSTNKKDPVAKGFQPPTLGDDDTPIEEVHKFYEYWIHFDSWRDFTAQATDELQVENEIENAESRFEKRWLQKEVDKRAKQLKTKENGRIQILVERAMEADPRLRRERQALQEAKERAKADREAAVERKKQEEEEAKLEEQRLAEEEKLRKAEEKVVREQEKKLIRKARQQLRKMTSSSFESAPIIWADSYDMSLDVDFLCNILSFEELKSLNDEFESTADQAAALAMIRERAIKEREAEAAQKSDQSAAVSAEMKEAAALSSSKSKQWTKDELSALAKAVKKYPPGGANRWDQIALFVNNLCKQEEPRSKEECIQKYNEITKASKPVDAAPAPSDQNKSKPAATPAEEESQQQPLPADANGDDDLWTAEQDQALQNALAQFPASMEKNARWSSIADAIPGKSKKQCVQRFKTIRESLKNRK